MATDQPYHLTPEEAIGYLKVQLAKMQREPRGSLLMDADTAFEKGYASAIFDLEHYTGPSPAEQYGDAVAELAELERAADE